MPKTSKNHGWWQPYLFLAPACFIFLLIYVGPMLATTLLSFTDWNGISREFHFVGLKNFIRIFTNTDLLRPLGNTLLFTVLTVILQSSLSLILAVALNHRFFGHNLLRGVFFLPCVVSSVAIGYAWSLIFNPVSGPIALVAKALGWDFLAGIRWLADPNIVLFSLVIVNVWQWTGWSMVIYLAGLQSIPQELYEAAAIDGAGGMQRFRYVTMPLILPSVTINVVMSTIGGLKAYDLMYIMTSGGPGHASQTFAMASVEATFLQKQAGLGSALSLVMFLMILLVSFVQNKWFSQKEAEVEA